MADQPPDPDTGVRPVVGRDREPTSGRPRWVSEIMHSLRASPVFALAVLTTLGLAGVIGLMVLLMQLQPGFLGMAHFTDPRHRTHELTYAFLFGVAVVGMLAQLRRPLKNIAGQLMALIPWVGLLLAAVLSTDAVVIRSAERMAVAALTIMTALIHPAGRDFFRSFSVSRVNWMMLALVIIAGVPLLSFASSNLGLQRAVPDDHAVMGHYGFMAAFGFTIIGVGLLASLRPDGWRLTACVAGLLPALLGLASVMYPDNASSLGLAWALVAMAWGIGFVAAAELTKDAASPKLLGLGGRTPKDDPRARPARESTSGTPRWVYVSGIIAIVLVVLFVILHLIGGGFGHTPPSSGQENTGGVGGPADADQAARTVEVTTLDTMTFQPSSITVSAGETVTFVVTNSGQAVHEFTLGDAAMQQQHAAEMAQMGDAMAHEGANSIRLLPGETKQLTWRFGNTGRLEYGCHEPGHYQAGMRGQIGVESRYESSGAK
jgi:uncharacterized cupredoxin-like copper-binding protein